MAYGADGEQYFLSGQRTLQQRLPQFNYLIHAQPEALEFPGGKLQAVADNPVQALLRTGRELTVAEDV